MNTKDTIMELADEYRHTISGSVEARQKLEAAIEAALEPTPEQLIAKGWRPIKCPLCGDVSAVTPQTKEST